MAATRVGGRWGESGPVGFAAGDGCLHCVVDVEDGALGAVVAVVGFVLAVDSGEGVQDVGDGVEGGGEVALEVGELLGRLVAGAGIGLAGRAPVAVCLRRQVQVEEGGVQFAAEDEAALLVPLEGWTVPAAIVGEVTKILSRVEEFEHPWHQECEVGIGEGNGGEDRGLLHCEVLEVDSAEFLASDEVEDKRVERAQQDGRQSGGGVGVHKKKLVSDCGERENVCERRTFLHAPGDVAPAHQPAGRGAGKQFLRKRERFVLGPQRWDGIQEFAVRLEGNERLQQGVGIGGIPGGARARAGLDLVERFSGKIVRTERLDTWRAVSAQAHLGRREGPGDRVSLGELDPGREDFVDCGICGACGYLAQPVDEQEVQDREDSQVRIAVA